LLGMSGLSRCERRLTVGGGTSRRSKMPHMLLRACVLVEAESQPPSLTNDHFTLFAAVPPG
jgi:hypothetical protein